MGDLHPDLSTALEAIEILEPTRYRISGQVRDVVAGHHDMPGYFQGSPPIPLPPLVGALEADLYARLYVRARMAELMQADALARRNLLNALSAVNSGFGGWEWGWTVGPSCGSGDHVAVTRDGVTFRTVRDNVRVRLGRFRPGEPCCVRVGKEFRNLLPQYYMAIGDADWGSAKLAPGRPLIRLYWHLTSEVAVPFMESVTTRLNAAGFPFRAKVLSTPQAYHRADAGVIYLQPQWYRRSGVVLARIYQDVQNGLRVDTPLFTKPLAAGLAVAEDPANGLSFGQHRCRLVALASWTSFTQGHVTQDARVATLVATMRAAGLDPLRPYLGPKSHDLRAPKMALAGDGDGQVSKLSSSEKECRSKEEVRS